VPEGAFAGKAAPSGTSGAPSDRCPGSIQPHGVLLTVEPSTWRVLQASTNTAAVLGVEAEDLLGTSVVELIGARPVERLTDVLAEARGASNPVPVELLGLRFDAIVHEVDGVVVLELEPTLPEDEFASVLSVVAAMNRIRGVTTRDALWAGAVRHLQDLTGFDRVTVFHVHGDGHAQVVAEARADESMESHLDQHLSASEMQAQAGDLSFAKPSCMIFSTDAPSSPLHPPEVPSSGQPLDLGRAELRAVCPAHLQVARSMGHVSSLSFTLSVGERLIGMVVCAHRTPRRLPYRVRRSLEAFAAQVAAQLNSISEVDRLASAAQLLETRSRLVEQFGSTGDLVQALFRGAATVLDLVPAAAAALHLDGVTSTIGDAPDGAAVSRVVEQLRARGSRLPIVSDRLVTEHPHLAGLLPAVAGVLIVPIDGGRGYLMWFRPAVAETADRSGARSHASGQAQPWQGLEEAAVQFSRDLDGAILRSRHSDLARFGFHDGLTGLPNRRLLIERIEQALAGRSRGGTVALLFVDITSLKAINESLGHDGGDDVLIQAAERLRSVTRASDTVARLAGDEFVVLAAGASRGSAPRIAERVLAALRAPFTVAGRPRGVTVSVGAAEAEDQDTAAELMRRAAAAMYRARRSGEYASAD
jgi:two-component system, chemotaxis family, sensor kinase Cph1